MNDLSHFYEPLFRADHPECLVWKVCVGDQPEAGESPGDRRDRATAVPGQRLQAHSHRGIQGLSPEMMPCAETSARFTQKRLHCVQVGLPGFYDPCVGEDKSLKLLYQFRGVMHQVISADDEALRIPKQC